MDALYWIKVDCVENADVAEIAKYMSNWLKTKFLSMHVFEPNEIFLYADSSIESVVGNEISYKDIKFSSDFKQIKRITIGHIGE